MGMELDVRIARDDDAEAISQVIVSALRETNAKDYSAGTIARLEKAFSPQAVRDLMSRRTMLVAISESRIVGTASLEGNVVRTVFVGPDAQGQGIGRHIMAEVERIARADGATALMVPSSVTAETFYAKLGFRAVRGSDHGDERTILMERHLAPI